jgi:hypothetical protein
MDMKTLEKLGNGKPLDELVTPWRAWANSILRQIGWYWYGVAKNYEEYFSDPEKFILFFQAAAYEYELEYGGEYGEFYKRQEKAMGEHIKTHGALPDFRNPLTNALWRISLGMSEKNLTNFLLEPEVKLILRVAHEFLRRIDLGYRPPFGEWPGVPPLEFFDGLQTTPDLETHEVVKLRVGVRHRNGERTLISS